MSGEMTAQAPLGGRVLRAARRPLLRQQRRRLSDDRAVHAGGLRGARPHAAHRGGQPLRHRSGPRLRWDRPVNWTHRPTPTGTSCTGTTARSSACRSRPRLRVKTVRGRSRRSRPLHGSVRVSGANRIYGRTDDDANVAAAVRDRGAERRAGGNLAVRGGLARVARCGTDRVWTEDGIIERFPSDGLKVVWRTPVKGGFAGPVVADGRVFVTDFEFLLRTRVMDGTERVLALDERTGEVLWTHESPAAYRNLQFSYATGPRATPTVDGDRVYVAGGRHAPVPRGGDRRRGLAARYRRRVRHDRAGMGYFELAPASRTISSLPSSAASGRAGRCVRQSAPARRSGGPSTW